MNAAEIRTVFDLTTDAKLLTEVVIDIDRHAQDGPLELEACLVAYAEIEKARSELAVAQGVMANRLAELMGEHTVVVEGYGTFERHRKTDRRKWDKDLLRAVLDTRMVDRDGVIADETPLDKVLHVWNLGTPRTTALRLRGLDPNEWCESEPAGWSLQVST